VTLDGVEALQVQKHCAVIGGTGWFQYCHYGEQFIVQAALCTAVEDGKLSADIPAVCAGHFSADDGVEE